MKLLRLTAGTKTGSYMIHLPVCLIIQKRGSIYSEEKSLNYSITYIINGIITEDKAHLKADTQSCP